MKAVRLVLYSIALIEPCSRIALGITQDAGAGSRYHLNVNPTPGPLKFISLIGLSEGRS